MDRDLVLSLSGEELYDSFVEEVLTNALNSDELVTALEQSKRYTDDFIFRIHIQTARQFINISMKLLNIVAEKAEDLIERARVLNLPKLLNLNYHILAICYKLMGHYEKALEYFLRILNSEKNADKKRLSAMASYYICEIYLVHDDNENALKYLEEAFKHLEESKTWEPRYDMKRLIFTSALFQLLYNTKDYQKMYSHVDELKKYSGKTNPLGLYTYNLAKLFYKISQNDFEEARKVLYDILDFCGDDDDSKLQQLKIYFALLSEKKLEPAFFEEELKLCTELKPSRLPYINYFIQKFLYENYTKLGKEVLAMESLRKSFDSMEKEMYELKSNKVNSFKMIEKNASMEEDINKEQVRNHELKLMAEEAFRNKELAECAFRRLSLVTELGKKLTLSLDLKDILDTVYTKLKAYLAVESFIIVIKDEEKKALRSIVYYEFDKPEEPFMIDQDNENSVFVETFKSNRIIKIDDFKEDGRYNIQQELMENPLFRSIVFMPLSVENEVIGAWSVQHSKPHIYSEENSLFLQELMPFLSIAINNAIKSEALAKEISQRKITQVKLEHVNHKLKILSSLDGLTQISNRRDFEMKILNYLDRAKKHGVSISLFMFDIDNFKLFNDSYGHLEGDEALKSIAMIIRKNFERAGGISARFGGEEFIGACLNLSETQSLALGERIRVEVLELRIENKRAPLGVLGISVGIAHSKTQEELKKSTLMRWADISLYNAKRTGKNKVVLKLVQPNEEAPEGLEEMTEIPSLGPE